MFINYGDNVKTKIFRVTQSENEGNNKFTVKAKAVEIAVKIYKWEGNVKTDAQSEVIVNRLTNCDDDKLSENLFDSVVSSCIVRDFGIFEHEYEIIVEESNCEIHVEVHYISSSVFG